MKSAKLNIHEAKTQLSRYLKLAEEDGNSFVICRRNLPIAEVRPLPKKRSEPRPIGLDEGLFVVPDDFNDPLPEWMLKAFEGYASEPLDTHSIAADEPNEP